MNTYSKIGQYIKEKLSECEYTIGNVLFGYEPSLTLVGTSGNTYRMRLDEIFSNVMFKGNKGRQHRIREAEKKKKKQAKLEKKLKKRTN